MALSFKAVEKAYEVFAELKQIIPLKIPSWPEDIAYWSTEQRENPKENTVYGCSRKADSGWENLVFFTKSPSAELLAKFDELKKKVPNSSVCRVDLANQDFWIIGWY